MKFHLLPPDAPIGSAPKGWTITMTGTSDPQWTVENDDTGPSQADVLKHRFSSWPEKFS
jgi:hypothetical protein